MFFEKKRQEETAAMKQFLEIKFKEMQDAICGVSGQMKKAEEEVRTLERAVSENTVSLHKHDMAIEDMLELLQEQEEREGARERTFQELDWLRNALIELAGSYQEQLFLVFSHIEREDAKTSEETKEISKEAWKNQMELVKKTIEKQLEKCGLKEIGCQGERVDYDKHEVIEAIDTCNAEEVLTVARVYAPGLLYGGHVRKKARVAAYRLSEQTMSEGVV